MKKLSKEAEARSSLTLKRKDRDAKEANFNARFVPRVGSADWWLTARSLESKKPDLERLLETWTSVDKIPGQMKALLRCVGRARHLSFPDYAPASGNSVLRPRRSSYTS